MFRIKKPSPPPKHHQIPADVLPNASEDLSSADLTKFTEWETRHLKTLIVVVGTVVADDSVVSCQLVSSSSS